jgi:hypothetical protein
MEEFIRQLLQDQGVPEDLSAEVRAQLVAELTGRATDFVNQRLVAAMSEEAVGHFESLLDEEPVDTQKIQDFINTNVPDKEQVAARALVEFRALYLGAKA